MKNKAERAEKRRRRVRDNVQIVVLFVLSLFFLTLCRYGWVQIVKGSEMSERVRMQSGEERVAQSPRGAILDANGRELAVSSMTKSLFVDPSHVGDAAQLAADLAPIVGLSEADILEDIDQGGGFVWVKRRMEPYMSDAVKALIREKSYGDCLGFRDEAKRYYPNDVLAANVLGFVGTDDKGLDGIEQQFDGLIKGVEEENFILTDMKSRPILSSLFMPDTYTGDRCKTVTLTIDSNIQFIVEQELDRAMAENAPQHATAIVMDPKTGNILALAMRPSYNPNEFGKYSSETWKNLAVSSIYEPGSTFKSVVAGAALEEKIVTPNQIFVDPGYVMVSGRRIQNWNGESFGTVTFTDVVKNSLNTGFALVGLDLGAERLTKYAKLFGFGEPTGVELPAEEGGILFEPENMRDSDMATMAIGHSIAVTPLQLVTAMAAIANDGILLKPHIVKEIRNADGSTYLQTKRDEVRRVLQSATTKTLVGLLEQVVAAGGGQKAQVKGYRIGGKTGTAQKIRPNGAGYMDGHYIASFCGFAPVDDPKVVVLVILDDPSGGNFYGGQIAAPVAGAIFSQIFRYMHIEPSSDPFVEMDEKRAQKEAQAPPKKKPRLPDVVPSGKVVMPDLDGLTIREAAEKLAEIGVTLEAEGSGRASYQSAPAYSVIDPGETVTVVFSP